MAASPPAPSLTDSEADGFVCSVCDEVYCSPRILPCFDTFCLDCLKDVSRENGGQSFPCPVCKEIIAVPAGGCDAFKVNKYITPKMLEAARAGPRPTMCSYHQAYRLEYFCVQCDHAICAMCKLTVHQNHYETMSMYKASVRCLARLEACKDRLEPVIDLLTKKSAAGREHLSVYKKKGAVIKEEIKAEADALVARVLKRRDVLLGKCERIYAFRETQLSTKSCEVQRNIDALLQLRGHVLRALGGSASHGEVVDAEKQMRDGRASEAQLEQVVSSCSPPFSYRPGLRPGDNSSSMDDDFDRCLGKLLEFRVPFNVAQEVIVPIYQCIEDGTRGEVHSVCPVTDNLTCVSFGGALPDYTSEKSICINNLGQVIDSEPLPGNRKSKYTRKFYTKEAGNFLYAKGGVLMATTQHEFGTQTISKISFETSPDHIFLFNVKTVAFDATRDMQLFAFVAEKISEDPQLAERTVLLFRYGQAKPFLTCSPDFCPEFYPTDVCFWQEDGQEEKLLVADAHNDAVYVLSVESNHRRLERCLASGNDLLVRPTALDVDWQNRVWIGCGNGRILMCKKDEMAAGTGDDKVVHLKVEYPTDPMERWDFFLHSKFDGASGRPNDEDGSLEKELIEAVQPCYSYR